MLAPGLPAQCSVLQLVLAANLPLKAKSYGPTCKHTEHLRPLAEQTTAAKRTQPGQQGDKLEYSLTSFVQIVKPSLKAGQVRRVNMPGSMSQRSNITP